MEQAAPPQVASKAAIHGTFLHDVIANHLIKKVRPARNTVPKEVTLDDLNMLQDHYDYLSMVLATCGEGVTYTVEQRCSLEEWGIPEVWGTPDMVIKDYANNTLHIPDHKFGITPVYAYENAQELIYAAANAGCPPNFKTFKLHILQYQVFETPDTYECDAKKVELFIEEVREALFEAKSAKPRFNPDPEACRWCRGGMVCRPRLDAEYSKALKVVRGMEKTPMVSLKELAQFFDYTETVVKYRSQIGKYLMEKVLSGESVPTKRVVAGRKSYGWTSEADLIKFVESRGLDAANIFKSKIMSPNQVKTAYRKFKKDEEFLKLISTKPGKPQLVDADDKRPDYLSLDDINFDTL
jgi:hypothetical protein